MPCKGKKPIDQGIALGRDAAGIVAHYGQKNNKTNAFAPVGRGRNYLHTQGVAQGYVLTALSLTLQPVIRVLNNS